MLIAMSNGRGSRAEYSPSPTLRRRNPYPGKHRHQPYDQIRRDRLADQLRREQSRRDRVDGHGVGHRGGSGSLQRQHP
jgi:hypothetical protein